MQFDYPQNLLMVTRLTFEKGMKVILKLIKLKIFNQANGRFSDLVFFVKFNRLKIIKNLLEG